jgi:hypothetical protein
MAKGGDGGVNPPDAGPGGTATVLACGATTCAIPAEACCVDTVNTDGGRGKAYACAASDAGCGGGGGDSTELQCSGAANCPATMVCCVHQTARGAASACQASCTKNQAQLCDKTAMPTGCGGDGGATMCSSNNIGDWGLSAPYATCGGRGN